MGKYLIIIITVVLLTACGVDPGDVALFEKAQVESSLNVGASFNVAPVVLGKLGYKCEMSSGEFIGENKKRLSAPTFLNCTKNSEKDIIACSLHTQVIVVPDSEKVSHIHFISGDVCL